MAYAIVVLKHSMMPRRPHFLSSRSMTAMARGRLTRRQSTTPIADQKERRSLDLGPQCASRQDEALRGILFENFRRYRNPEFAGTFLRRSRPSAPFSYPG